jgi:hypothetical protein
MSDDRYQGRPPRSGGRSGPPRRDGDRPSLPRGGDDRPFRKREDGDKPRRFDGDKPFTPRGGDKPFGDKRPYVKREEGDRPFRAKSFGAKPYSARPGSDRPPARSSSRVERDTGRSNEKPAPPAKPVRLHADEQFAGERIAKVMARAISRRKTKLGLTARHCRSVSAPACGSIINPQVW